MLFKLAGILDTQEMAHETGVIKIQFWRFDNSFFEIGANFFKNTIWYFINAIIFKSSFFPFYKLKVFLLKIFGSKIGKNVLIKPCVNIKYPWKLEIKNNVWIGEMFG